MNLDDSNRSKWRRISAIVLVVLASILVPLSLAAIWLDNQIQDTDKYVETVAPLSYDDDIANAVSERLTDELFQAINVEQQIEEVLPEQGAFLAGPLTGRLQDFTQETTRDVIKSDQFNKVWVEANRVAHSAVTGLILGDGDVLKSEGGVVTLDLNPIVADVKQSLSDAGVDIFDNVSSGRIDLQYTLVESQGLADVQDAVRTLERLAWFLPFLVLVSWVGAVWLSLDRRRTILCISIGLSLSMVVLMLFMTIGRSSLLDAISAAGGSTAAAAALYDSLLRVPLSVTRWVFVTGFIVAGISWIVWPAGFMVRARGAIVKWAVGLADNNVLGPIIAWIDQYKKGLQAAGLFVILLVLVWKQWPSLSDVITLGLILVIYLGLVEGIARLRDVGSQSSVTR